MLSGGSWGAFLGVNIVKARPDLFYAYVGSAQIVSTEDWAAGYSRTMELARQAQDSGAIAELESIGPPPWDHIRKFGIWSRWTRLFEAKAAGPPVVMKPSPEYSYEAERKQWEDAANFSQAHFFGLDMRGPAALLNLPALGTDFDLPMFIVQGEADLKTVPKVTRAYFDSIRAPSKQFILVNSVGHEPNAAMLKAMLDLMKERVRPLAVAP